MVFGSVCYFCETNPRSVFHYYCNDCTKLKRTINLMGDRVYEVVENVLSRNKKEQESIIKDEIKEEIKAKTDSLEEKEMDDLPPLIEQPEEEELQGSVNHYDNRKQILSELKERIKKDKKK